MCSFIWREKLCVRWNQHKFQITNISWFPSLFLKWMHQDFMLKISLLLQDSILILGQPIFKTRSILQPQIWILEILKLMFHPMILITCFKMEKQFSCQEIWKKQRILSKAENWMVLIWILSLVILILAHQLIPPWKNSQILISKVLNLMCLKQSHLIP